ncbi:MAG: dipeptidase [Bacteroidetes bacterium]|nr:dipeptidase [Bacteroidales bacterium]NJO69393.1 dipeptidase [Bacteroidota bacterium]
MIRNYIESNSKRFLEELFELLRIPSISATSEHKLDMYKAAEFIKKALIDAGADHADIMPTSGQPVIFGQKIINTDLPTVMVYGHYDVQPVDPVNLWNSHPFSPEIRDGKIYARGADDNKGQLYMHLKAFELMMRTDTLPCNVKFLIEGEEEIGSPNLKKFCTEHQEMLKCDVILVSDTTMIGKDIPSITVGLRGLAYLEVEVTGPNRDLHSGLFGGAVANPVQMLADMISSLKNDKKEINIPGFYDDVIKISTEERKEMAKAPFNLEKYKSSLAINDVSGEEGYTTIERTGIRPALDVCGIWGGYTGEGAKTVLPAKAYAKISMRLVPNQSPDKIAKLFEDHFIKSAPAGVTVKVTNLHGGRPYVSPVDTKAYRAAEEAMKTTFGVNPVPFRSGGSIPVIADFEEVLGVKTILMGFGLESDAIHSPNENFSLELFLKGIETIPHFYRNFAKA